MIELSNGHRLEFLVASGALGFDGEGYIWELPFRWANLLNPESFDAITLKTLTYAPRQGNLRWHNGFQVVKRLKDHTGRCIGHVNSIGLTNPGFKKWYNDIRPVINPNYKIIVSITTTSKKEMLEMIDSLNNIKNLVAVEYNTSCPNSRAEKDLMENVDAVVELALIANKYSYHPIIIKLGCQQKYLEIAKRLTQICAAISINSVPWKIIYPNKLSPLPEQFGSGGVSGLVAQPYTWSMLNELNHLGSIPVIGTSVWDYPDMIGLHHIGAGAISFGSIFIKGPFSCLEPNQFIKRFKKEYKNF